MNKKICNKCKVEKDISNFHKKKGDKYGVRYICKKCRESGTEEYYEKKRLIKLGLKKCNQCQLIKSVQEFSARASRNNNPESYCKKCNSKRSKQYYYKYPEECKLKNKQFYINHPSYLKQRYNKNEGVRIKSAISSKKYRIQNLERCINNCNNYYKQHRKELINKAIQTNYKKRQTIRGQIDHRMSITIRQSLTKEIKNGRTWKQFVNYTTKELKEHLEKTMTPFMTWDLFMKGRIHIDHIMPKSSFIYSTPEDREFKKCWALDNLQLLWALENWRKNDKFN